MGNYRFKFSDMIPNAWFYKLNNISNRSSKTPNQKPPRKKIQPKLQQPPSFSSPLSPISSSSAAVPPPVPHHEYQRKSYHFTRELPDNLTSTSPRQLSIQPPRKSLKKRRHNTNKTKKTNTTTSHDTSSSCVSADCSCRVSVESVWTKPDSTPEDYPNYQLNTCSSAEDHSNEDDNESLFPEIGSDHSFPKTGSWPNSCHHRVKSDTYVDMKNNPKFEKISGFDPLSQFDLPPIITKNNNVNEKKKEATKFKRNIAKVEEKDAYIINNTSKERTSKKLLVNSSTSPGVKLRTNSPRIVTKRYGGGRKSVSSGGGRRSITESFAIVKSSQDPERDFKESMVEMIMENNIRTPKDLEDLLACYLSLNSDQYHDLIIKVFKQIWIQITEIGMK